MKKLSAPRTLALLLLGLPLLADARSESRLLEKHSSGKQLLWSDGRLSIDAERPPRLGRIGLALLRMRTKSPRRLFLPAKSRFLPLESGINLVLVPIDDISELDKLAPLAHEELGLCGSLEFIANDYKLQQTIEFAPPYFAARAHFTELEAVTKAVQLSNIDAHINQITSLSTRFHSSTVGKTASTMLVNLWTGLTQAPNRWTISEYTHSRTEQKSVIARLPGIDPNAPTLVLGAHLDSISRSGSDPDAPAPGADDDAAGLAILSEILRVIEEKQLTFYRPIELHAYAAEEIGLIGSREIASAYRSQKRKIAGMMQFDMAYYSEGSNSGVINLLEDFGSRDLRRSAIEWINAYIGPYYKIGRLPSGSSSDHKAWWEQGYSTVFPFEDPEAYNRSIHSVNDTRENFDDGQLILRIAQLGLVYTSYQAGLQQLDTSFQSQTDSLLRSELSETLYLALEPEDAGDAGTASYFAVSAPTTAKTLEFCPIDAGDNAHCTNERQTLTHFDEVATRRVFYAKEGLSLEKGQKFWITAYDSQDKLLAERRIELE